jgi:hypothetical protein
VAAIGICYGVASGVVSLQRVQGWEDTLSGTIIRGTLKTPNSQLVTPISIKL